MMNLERRVSIAVQTIGNSSPNVKRRARLLWSSAIKDKGATTWKRKGSIMWSPDLLGPFITDGIAAMQPEHYALAFRAGRLKAN